MESYSVSLIFLAAAVNTARPDGLEIAQMTVEIDNHQRRNCQHQCHKYYYCQIIEHRRAVKNLNKHK
jgi:hypothetical protein